MVMDLFKRAQADFQANNGQQRKANSSRDNFLSSFERQFNNSFDQSQRRRIDNSSRERQRKIDSSSKNERASKKETSTRSERKENDREVKTSFRRR